MYFWSSIAKFLMFDLAFEPSISPIVYALPERVLPITYCGSRGLTVPPSRVKIGGLLAQTEFATPSHWGRSERDLEWLWGYYCLYSWIIFICISETPGSWVISRTLMLSRATPESLHLRTCKLMLGLVPSISELEFGSYLRWCWVPGAEYYYCCPAFS